MGKLHGVVSSSLGEGAQDGGIAKHFRQGDMGLDMLGATLFSDGLNFRSSLLDIAKDIA